MQPRKQRDRNKGLLRPRNPQVRDAALKKAKAADDARDAVEAERDALRSQIASLEREVAAAKQVRNRFLGRAAGGLRTVWSSPLFETGQ